MKAADRTERKPRTTAGLTCRLTAGETGLKGLLSAAVRVVTAPLNSARSTRPTASSSREPSPLRGTKAPRAGLLGGL